MSERAPSSRTSGGRRGIKVAGYYRTGETSVGGEALVSIRLYTGGNLEATMSVPATLLEPQLEDLRKQGYSVKRVQT